jgi:hypothetical protein
MRTRFIARHAFPLLLGVLGACTAAGGDDAAGARRWGGTIDTLPGGAVAVRNPDAPLWDSASTWRITEELRIGSADEEGPAMFGSVSDVAVDAAGRIYVLDGQAQEIRVFGRDGAHVRTIGRKGGGPGELADAVAVRMLPGRTELWVVDYGNARYARFDTAGTQLDMVRRPFGFRAYPWRGVVDTAGRIVEQNIAYAADGGEPRDVLIAFDSGGAPADTAYLPTYEPESFTVLNAAGRPMFSMSVPFTPRQVLALDPRRRVWSGVTDRYALAQRGWSGDTLRVVELTREARPVSAAEGDSAFAGIEERIREAAGGPGARMPTVERSRLGRSHPLFGEAFVDDGGHLWVRSDGGAAAGGGFDVFDPDGRYLGFVGDGIGLMGFMVRPQVVGDRIYGVVRDPVTDVEFVVRARIEGRTPGR